MADTAAASSSETVSRNPALGRSVGGEGGGTCGHPETAGGHAALPGPQSPAAAAGVESPHAMPCDVKSFIGSRNALALTLPPSVLPFSPPFPFPSRSPFLSPLPSVPVTALAHIRLLQLPVLRLAVTQVAAWQVRARVPASVDVTAGMLAVQRAGPGPLAAPQGSCLRPPI
ncbi:unnamed protein product [Closterium sp. Naga37s-1]|nr:unnamed protein product [Closterium sp. Naga37s-1]